MKWGIHRAKKKGTTYTYKSLATKRYEKRSTKALKKAEKLKAKGENKAAQEQTKIANQHKKYAERSAKFDKRMETSVRKSSAAKTAVKILLGGTFGAKTYEAAKAAGYGQTESAIASYVTSTLAGPIGNMALNGLLRYKTVTR